MGSIEMGSRSRESPSERTVTYLGLVSGGWVRGWVGARAGGSAWVWVAASASGRGPAWGGSRP